MVAVDACAVTVGGTIARNRRRLGPVDLLILQGTTRCNLDCSYCYLTPEARSTGKVMSHEIVERLIDRLVEEGMLGDRLECMWHSGEPLILDPDYYRRAVAIIDAAIARSGSDCAVRYGFQTNAVAVSDKWIDFFRELSGEGRLHLGVSLDGPADMHDRNRRNWGGRGSHGHTMRGLHALAQAGIGVDLIMVLSEEALLEPDRIYDFLIAERAHYRDVRLNLPDEFDTAGGVPGDGAAALYDHFLRRFNVRIRDDGADAPIPSNFREFYRRVADIAGGKLATTRSGAFSVINVDSDGSVSTFLAGLTADQKFGSRGQIDAVVGNIAHDSFAAMSNSANFLHLQRAFDQSERACAASCEFHALCPGGYALVQANRHDAFDLGETPECNVQVKLFSERMLEALEEPVGAA
ncbi:radical SAM protein [Erythrobacter sp. KY5]|uniref:radical SAM protein n=1 Tax=Erythrobacter sp. KY5 TaxID=2011159 RepID=UPI0013A6AEE0|nr:radical SAM protein [Erythrobacter sp. KY5]